MRKHIYHKATPFTQHNRNTWQGLTSPDDIEYRHIPDLHAFCIAHKLNHDAVYKLTQGELEEVEGWRRR